MTRLERKLRLSFKKVRKQAESCILSEQEGTFEVCDNAWLIVSEVRSKQGHGGKHRLWELRAKTPVGSPETRTGIIVNGKFPTNRGIAGEGFSRLLDQWEEDGPKELASFIYRTLQNMRGSGLTKKGLMDAWDDSLIMEVMDG